MQPGPEKGLLKRISKSVGPAREEPRASSTMGGRGEKTHGSELKAQRRAEEEKDEPSRRFCGGIYNQSRATFLHVAKNSPTGSTRTIDARNATGKWQPFFSDASGRKGERGLETVGAQRGLSTDHVVFYSGNRAPTHVYNASHGPVRCLCVPASHKWNEPAFIKVAGCSGSAAVAGTGCGCGEEGPLRP